MRTNHKYGQPAIAAGRVCKVDDPAHAGTGDILCRVADKTFRVYAPEAIKLGYVPEDKWVILYHPAFCPEYLDKTHGVNEVNEANATLVTHNPTIEELAYCALWGTMGEDGLGPLRWIRLKDADTGHLEAILRTQYHIADRQRKVIRWILNDRVPSYTPEPSTERKMDETEKILIIGQPKETLGRRLSNGLGAWLFYTASGAVLGVAILLILYALSFGSLDMKTASAFTLKVGSASLFQAELTPTGWAFSFGVWIGFLVGIWKGIKELRRRS